MKWTDYCVSKLPTHFDFGIGKGTYNLLPPRFADNFKSRNSVLRDWTEDRVEFQNHIELAYSKRENEKTVGRILGYK
ncbi:MAG: hypothetical protein WD607_05965 [Candidatus Paceibacterota bacterium]